MTGDKVLMEFPISNSFTDSLSKLIDDKLLGYSVSREGPNRLLAEGLEEVYDTKQHLLYVACTRARESP